MAKYFSMKVANMKKPQDFILYPYSGEDTILLQSESRFATVNLKTGEGFINGKGKPNANSITLQMNPVSFVLPDDVKTAIQSYLWHNNGKDGNIRGVVHFENKELFSR